jgi:hypothetical protein
MASWDDDGYYDASFAVCKCRRYHAKLRDFYQGAYNWTMAANAFGASGAFVAILGSQSVVAGILAGLVALASLFESIFKYESRARVHHELCVRFTKLAADMEKMEATPENLATVRQRRLEIEMDEPNEKRLVERMASIDEARSRGVAESELDKLTWFQRNCGFVATFGMKRLEKQRAAREAARARKAAEAAAAPLSTPGS